MTDNKITDNNIEQINTKNCTDCYWNYSINTNILILERLQEIKKHINIFLSFILHIKFNILQKLCLLFFVK